MSARRKENVRTYDRDAPGTTRFWVAPSHNRGAVTRRVVLFNYGHKWMRMWKGHEPSPDLAARAKTPMRRQLLGLTGAYYGDDAELDSV